MESTSRHREVVITVAPPSFQKFFAYGIPQPRLQASSTPGESGGIDGYLEKLNDRQRQAVAFDSDPLLVIAEAGSGKAITLAHCVAHILVVGGDPRRILLMTFSRRATTELTRRVTLPMPPMPQCVSKRSCDFICARPRMTCFTRPE